MEMELKHDVNSLISLFSSEEKMLDISEKAKAWSQNYTLDTFDAEIEKLLLK